MNIDYMKIAILESQKALKKNEVPIGAVIVKNNKIIAKKYNKKNIKNFSLLHAEILCIYQATKKLKTWNLNDCDLYVTLKPCEMCEKIIKESRIKNVYYLADKLNYKKEYNKTNIKKIDHSDLEIKYLKELNNFFKNKRK